MHPAYASAPRRWLYALKPGSWPKVLAPALLGHVLGYMAAETWSLEAAAIGLTFAACATAYVVLLNDWFDADVDALKRAMFPHAGSPKTIPDAILVSGAITGEAAKMVDLEAVKQALPTTPVLANTGVKHATVKDVLAVADGCIVGSSLKVDGDTWKPVDAERAAEFMRLVRAARGY